MENTRRFDYSDLGLLSGPPVPAFVSGSRLAAELTGVDYGKVTLLDLEQDRVLIRASHGFDPDKLGIDWSATDLPLCRKIIADRGIVEIGEANEIASTRQSPFLQALNGRSYLARRFSTLRKTPSARCVSSVVAPASGRSGKKNRSQNWPDCFLKLSL